MATNYRFDPANIPGAIVEKEGPRENNGTFSPDTDLEMLLQSASENAAGTQYGSPSGDDSSAAQPVGANNELLAEQKPRAFLNGAFHSIGLGANVLGGPVTALTWLVNELSRHGMTLKAGQAVTTGTCVKPVAIAAGDVVGGDFGELGGVSVSFA